VRVDLGKDLAWTLAAGHPWVWREALANPPTIATGTVVDVHGRDGKFVARGLWDDGSPIAVRIYTRDVAEKLDGELVRRRLAAAKDLRVLPVDTDCYRLVNGEGDYLPGVVVDVYAGVAVLRLDGDAVEVLRDQIVAALVELGFARVFLRSRGARGLALHGGEPPRPVEVREHGVKFAVDLHAGQKTGFFLDQRDNRRLLARWARGRTVANLFGYTGGFSVHCALGGASIVDTVDVARQALADAERNFAINGLDPKQHGFHCVDAFDWLRAAQRDGRRWGLVIVDPPSFAPSEKAKKPAIKAYRELNALALSVVEPGGLFAAASCSSHITGDDFLDILRDAAYDARRRLRILEVRGQPADHPSLPAFPEGRYLKFVLTGTA
jgi:23S rRNA (cytosine1962-C5)-methyltransferase